MNDDELRIGLCDDFIVQQPAARIVALVALQLDDLAHLLVLLDAAVAVEDALHRLANALEVQVSVQALLAWGAGEGEG